MLLNAEWGREAARVQIPLVTEPIFTVPAPPAPAESVRPASPRGVGRRIGRACLPVRAPDRSLRWPPKMIKVRSAKGKAVF